MALQVWLPLDGNLSNQGLDGSIIAINNNAVIDNNGKIGKCYKFGTETSSITIPVTTLKTWTGEFSISCWVNIVSWNSSYATIFSGHNGAQGWANLIFCLLRNNATSKLCFCISNTSSATNTSCITGDLTLNTWYHFVCVYSAGNIKLYQNGTLVSSYNTNIIPAMNKLTQLILGKNASSYQSNCKLNDFRIYDHALSTKEIKELSKGLILHYRLTKPLPNILKNTGNGTYSSNSYANGTWGAGSGGNGTFSIIEDISVPVGKYSWNITGNTSGNRDYFQGKIPFELNKKYTASWWAKGNGKILFRIWDSTSSTARISDSTNILTSEWTYYTKTFTANQNMVDHSCNYQLGVTGSANISICGMKLEEGEIATIWIPNETDALYSAMGYDSNIEPDCSGYKRDGIIVGTITRNVDTPRYKTCNNITNNSSYIKIDNLQTSGFSNSYSFSWWGKISSFSGRMFWGFSNGIRLNGIYNGNLWNTGDGSNNPLYTPGTTTQIAIPSVNKWHHFVMTGDGTNCKLYLDGKYYGIAKTYKSISGTTIYINGWDNGTTYSGQIYISDFRIYCTTLSADDAKALYEDAGYVDKNGNFHAYEYVEI